MNFPPCIYIASPLGFSEIGQAGLAQIVGLIADEGFTPINPFALAPTSEIARIAALPSLDAQRAEWRTLAKIIGDLNKRSIDLCQGVLAILDGPDVDSGTAAEIGYAFARGKPIVGYRGDCRLASDNIGRPSTCRSSISSPPAAERSSRRRRTSCRRCEPSAAILSSRRPPSAGANQRVDTARLR